MRALSAVAHARRFRFGILVSRAGSAAEWREVARKAEGLGYATAKEATTVDLLTEGRLDMAPIVGQLTGT